MLFDFFFLLILTLSPSCSISTSLLHTTGWQCCFNKNQLRHNRTKETIANISSYCMSMSQSVATHSHSKDQVFVYLLMQLQVSMWSGITHWWRKNCYQFSSIHPTQTEPLCCVDLWLTVLLCVDNTGTLLNLRIKAWVINSTNTAQQAALYSTYFSNVTLL